MYRGTGKKSHKNRIFSPFGKRQQTTTELVHRTKAKEIDNRMIIIRKVYVYSRITIKSPLFTQRTVEYINTRWNVGDTMRKNDDDWR